jgi:RNA polymerase sigma factor (sigma-70 family)
LVQLKVVAPNQEPPGLEGEVLAALERGDRRGALTVLMRGYGDAVYQFCRRTLRDAALTQDVHQQIFVQAWEDLPQFSGRSSLRTWLFGIAHHRCLDASKVRRRFWERFAPSAAPSELEDQSARPEEQLLRTAVERGLLQCLGTLAPATRTAVTLRFTEGFSYEEMSTICGEKANTLQARVARALPVIKRCMETRGLSP